MPQNRATIYSNGIADFQRVLTVTNKAPRHIEIPFRQSHLADVLASLTIIGDVRIDSPPSFQPANQDEGIVTIPRTNALDALILQLVGAEVEFEFEGERQAGKIVGIDDYQIAGTGEPISERHLVIMSKIGLNKFSLRKIVNLRFVETEVHQEMQKALNRRLRDIKPNSTFVEFDLSTKKKSTEVIVQYAIPAAAWKITYRLILRKNGKLELQGHVVVDNNTDLDWNDYIISVVLGQPITFSTDLADTKIPSRSHVNVVQETAVASIEIEQRMQKMKRAGGPPRSAASEPEDKLLSRFASERGASAQTSPANVTETGDYCQFETAHPVTIAARSSAVLPVFETELEHSRQVLHFKSENHPDRPFRTLLFQNQTTHSLGRGVCTVFDETIYAGSCILPATRANEKAMLAHALETAVPVAVDAKPIESRRLGIRVTDGVAIENYHKLKRTEYTVTNGRDRSFRFLLDHEVALHAAKVACHLVRDTNSPELLDCESLKSAQRIEFDLLPNETVQLALVETSVSKSQVRLVGSTISDDHFNVHWLFTNFVDANTTLATDPDIKRCVELQRIVNEKKDQIAYAEHQLERLATRQERLRKNIKSLPAEAQLVKWRDDLQRAEEKMVQLEEEHLPELVREYERRRTDLFDALHNLSIEWSE